jgi:hypothetical protein
MICHLIGFQALKSGQLPADIQSLTDNIMTDNVNEKPEDADLGESNDTQEQKNTDSTAMEQVCVYFSLCRSSFSC